MRKSLNNINSTVRITASVLGAIVAISGIHHGIFEILQGNKATESFIIQSIGMEHQRWLNGEEAFTLIPNFMISGITSVIVSTIIIFWSLFRLHKSSGPVIFILLYILLTIAGGGIGHILFFVTIWLFSGRIRKEIAWRSGSTDSGFVHGLSYAWIFLLIATCVLFIAALEISVFGLAGASDEVIMTTIRICLLLSLISMLFTFYAALVRDIRTRFKEREKTLQ